MPVKEQLAMFPEFEPPKTWECDDDYETPDYVANMLAAQCLSGDRVIVDAGAGCGNVTEKLPWGNAQVIPIEANPKRCAIGRERLPSLNWMCRDFLDVKAGDLGSQRADGKADLVIGNPPFSLLTSFINHSFAELLQPKGRVVFLLPGDTFHKPDATLNLIKFDFSLDERKVIGRIAYLKDGRPQSGRQVYDSIFILQRAKRPDLKLLSRQEYTTLTKPGSGNTIKK